MSYAQKTPEVKISNPEVRKITVAPVAAYLVAKRRRDQRQRQLYTNVCCVIITVVIFVTSVVLITAGAVFSIEDLWILGLIIIIGGIIVLSFVLGKYLYPMLVKTGARVSDKHTEEQKIHKNEMNYMERLKRDMDLSEKPKLTDKQLYKAPVAKTVSEAEGGGKTEMPKPPLISVPGENGIVTIKKGLIYDDIDHENTPDDDIDVIPHPSTYDLYYNPGGSKGQIQVSPPPPYLPCDSQMDTTSKTKLDTYF